MGKEFDYSDIENLKIDTLTTDDEERKKKIAKADLLVSWIESHKVFLEFDLLEALDLYKSCNIRGELDSKINKVEKILNHRYLNEKVLYSDRNEMSKYINRLVIKTKTNNTLWDKIVLYTRVLECLPMSNIQTVCVKNEEERIKKFIAQSKPLVDLMNQGDSYLKKANQNESYKSRFELLKKAVACYQKLQEYKIDCSKKLDICDKELDALRFSLCYDAENYVNKARNNKRNDVDLAISYYEWAIEYYRIAIDIRESTALRNNYNMVVNEYERITTKYARRENFKRGLKEFFEGMKEDIVEIFKFDLTKGNYWGTSKKIEGNSSFDYNEYDDENYVKPSYTSNSKSELEEMERKLEHIMDDFPSIKKDNKVDEYVSDDEEDRVIDEYYEKAVDCYSKAIDKLPDSLDHVSRHSPYIVSNLNEANTLLEEAIRYFYKVKCYSNRQNDINNCKYHIKYIGECFEAIADEYYEDAEEDYENTGSTGWYSYALNYYEKARELGCNCRKKIDACYEGKRR